MLEETTLSSKLRRSARSMGLRAGALVPLNYGSAGGELAVCMRSVGLIDREDLRAISIEVDATTLDALLGKRFAAGLHPGEAGAADALWGRIAAGRCLAVTEVDRSLSLLEALQEELGPEAAGATITSLVAIGVLGPAAPGLLADLGVYGALAGRKRGGAIATAAFAGSPPAAWMMLDNSWTLVLVEPAHVSAAWEEISAAGRRFGLGYVGAEAAERFEIVRRQCGEQVVSG